jgi:hypothetical protein
MSTNIACEETNARQLLDIKIAGGIDISHGNSQVSKITFDPIAKVYARSLIVTCQQLFQALSWCIHIMSIALPRFTSFERSSTVNAYNVFVCAES